MNLHDYLKHRSRINKNTSIYRDLCRKCLQPDFGCFCKDIISFDPEIQFVILIHPIENRRRIATGRLSHLCLNGSRLILGQNYTSNKTVNDLVENPDFYPVILYPGETATNLTALSCKQRASLFPKNKKLTIFVIDGTWATAKKTLRKSKNLSSLPRICFTPNSPSSFRARQQPTAECVSTVEAIHQTIELLGPACGFDTLSRKQDILLSTFDKMVEMKLSLIQENRKSGRLNRRRVTKPLASA